MIFSRLSMKGNISHPVQRIKVVHSSHLLSYQQPFLLAHRLQVRDHTHTHTHTRCLLTNAACLKMQHRAFARHESQLPNYCCPQPPRKGPKLPQEQNNNLWYLNNQVKLRNSTWRQIISLTISTIHFFVLFC